MGARFPNAIDRARFLTARCLIPIVAAEDRLVVQM
jgi:hypothetical protein